MAFLGLSEQGPRGDEDNQEQYAEEMSVGSQTAQPKSSQYHLPELQNFLAGEQPKYHYVTKDELPPLQHYETATSEIMTKTQLRDRVQRLDSGFYHAVVVDGRLHFVSSGTENTRTGRSNSPQTARSQPRTSNCSTPRGSAEKLVNVDDVVNFFKMPGAKAAFAEYKLQRAMKKSAGNQSFDSTDIRTALDDQSSKDVGTARSPSLSEVDCQTAVGMVGGQLE